jgi:Domain of unknown function (DUF4338)/DDE_Tnp_1-associated
MNTAKKKQRRHLKQIALSGNSPEIRVIKASERKRFEELLGSYHYLGEGRPVGDCLRMVASIGEEWVALLVWSGASYRLKPRDEFIGWTAAQRAQRQKLIVQNTRYLLLGERGEHPNLASQVLGAAVKQLPGLWYEHFGYSPLLAETFTDIEAFEGTCYKASGWKVLGQTKGYSRSKADFFVPNDRPKKLWVKELKKEAAALLRAPTLPEEYLKGAKSCADGVMPIKANQIRSLHECLCSVPDPRADNKTFHIGAVLSIVAMGILSGHRNLASIVRFAERMTIPQRQKIRLPLFRKKGTSYRKIPSYKVFWNLLSELDIDAFSECLSGWLSEHAGRLPRALALDGKFIKDTVGVICMVDHETGAPCAMIKTSKKEGEGDDCEIKAAQRLIKQQKDLSGAVITADALHCQRETAQDIVAGGGEYILQIKDNQKGLRKRAALKTEDLSPFLPKPKRVMDEQTPGTSP